MNQKQSRTGTVISAATIWFCVSAEKNWPDGEAGHAQQDEADVAGDDRRGLRIAVEVQRQKVDERACGHQQQDGDRAQVLAQHDLPGFERQRHQQLHRAPAVLAREQAHRNQGQQGQHQDAHVAEGLVHRGAAGQEHVVGGRSSRCRPGTPPPRNRRSASGSRSAFPSGRRQGTPFIGASLRRDPAGSRSAGRCSPASAAGARADADPSAPATARAIAGFHALAGIGLAFDVAACRSIPGTGRTATVDHAGDRKQFRPQCLSGCARSQRHTAASAPRRAAGRRANRSRAGGPG